MSPKGRGNKTTPPNVVELLREEVDRTSQAATSRATGLTLQTVQRYIKGIGEPTTATLQKLADYFGVSVAWLRGERYKGPCTDAEAQTLIQVSEDLLKIHTIIPAELKRTIQVLMLEQIDEIADFIYIRTADIDKGAEDKLVSLSSEMQNIAMPTNVPSAKDDT